MTPDMLTIFLQLLFTSLVCAAPMDVHTQDAWQYGTGGGIIGFIVLVFDAIVWIELFKSSRPVSHKILWGLLVFVFPIGGIIIYWLFSNRGAHKGGYETIV